jgi:reverse gyrase
MELFKNEFYCKECGKIGFADSVDAIIKRKKLCSKCFCKSLGFEEEAKETPRPTFNKKKDIVTKELNNHNSLKRESVKKKAKHKKEGGGWRWL